MTTLCEMYITDIAMTEEDITTEATMEDSGRAATTQEASKLIHAGPIQIMTVTLAEDTVAVMEAAMVVVDMAVAAITDAETIMVSSLNNVLIS